MDEKINALDSLDVHLGEAAKALKKAWRVMKGSQHFESTAKEIADTVLDVEEAHRKIKSKITEFEMLKKCSE